MNEPSFLNGMAQLSAAFPSQSLEPKTQAVRKTVYWGRLRHLDETQWRRAVENALDFSGFYPSVAVLLEAAGPPEEAPRLDDTGEKPSLRRGTYQLNEFFRTMDELKDSGKLPPPIAPDRVWLGIARGILDRAAEQEASCD